MLFLKTQRERIDAKALTGRFSGTVGEDVPQVSAAVGANHFNPVHTMGTVVHEFHGALNCLVKTRPTAVRLKFAAAFKELRSAIGAGVGAIDMMI